MRMVRERLKPAAHVRNEQNSSQGSHSSILSSSLGADIMRNTARKTIRKISSMFYIKPTPS